MRIGSGGEDFKTRRQAGRDFFPLGGGPCGEGIRPPAVAGLRIAWRGGCAGAAASAPAPAAVGVAQGPEAGRSRVGGKSAQSQRAMPGVGETEAVKKKRG